MKDVEAAGIRIPGWLRNEIPIQVDMPQAHGICSKREAIPAKKADVSFAASAYRVYWNREQQWFIQIAPASRLGPCHVPDDCPSLLQEPYAVLSETITDDQAREPQPDAVLHVCCDLHCGRCRLVTHIFFHSISVTGKQQFLIDAASHYKLYQYQPRDLCL